MTDPAPSTLFSESRAPLFLLRQDASLAMREARLHPWLGSGLDRSILPIMLDPPPAWIPKPGDRMPSAHGSLLVLRRELVQPRTTWPWLLCALESPGLAPTASPPGAQGSLPHFSRRSRIYCALLFWRAGHALSTIDERGSTLRLLTARDLARAAMSMAPAPLTEGKLGTFRSARGSKTASLNATRAKPDPLERA